MKKKGVLIIDAGHGGFVKGSLPYLTKGKKAFHEGYDMHDRGWFYEGVSNRQTANILAEMCKGMQVPYTMLHHYHYDTPLRLRASQANLMATKFPGSVLVSIHSNSFDRKAKGFEVYTSPGVTKSDAIAESIYHQVDSQFNDGGWEGNKMGVRMRPDRSDGDHDKEARFWMLTKTICPAVLVENLFFDNRDEALMLMSRDTHEMFASCILNAYLENT